MPCQPVELSTVSQLCSARAVPARSRSSWRTWESKHCAGNLGNPIESSAFEKISTILFHLTDFISDEFRTFIHQIIHVQILNTTFKLHESLLTDNADEKAPGWATCLRKWWSPHRKLKIGRGLKRAYKWERISFKISCGCQFSGEDFFLVLLQFPRSTREAEKLWTHVGRNTRWISC